MDKLKRLYKKLLFSIWAVCLVYTGAVLQLYLTTINNLDAAYSIPILNKIACFFMFGLTKEYKGTFSQFLENCICLFIIVYISFVVTSLIVFAFKNHLIKSKKDKNLESKGDNS